MVLILNCFIDDQFAKSFDEAVIRQLAGCNKKCNFVRAINMKEAENSLQDLDTYTHLIISGSEASTLEDSGWEKKLETIVVDFISRSKAVLGICYGHQFIVRSIAGKNFIRKAQKPEMGWEMIQLYDNLLFKNIENPVIMVAHYDEVFDLPEEFKAIATSPHCNIHGFQYKDLPVWGVQFHPEYGLAEGQEIFEVFSKQDKDFNDWYINNLEKESQLLQNSKFIKNFLNSDYKSI
ncbi:glutamine amidotransferase class-I [Clostridium aceticum]|uniref:Glutamine amidotransferase class-I n=1 Tax=Clostridium aceticum TaxID=84022 RepID=A0A0D8I8W7_9CLOT|nr:gamma-glutamyl-gamma-aminobutyrate hydrolase family protein [Clostridium aceticum]AKL94647.1 glutamine amidotransferase class-I [Clostridium aceticum]KJF26457.1 hypothetical protein TZ02_13060 [Clostridium aceticum]